MQESKQIGKLKIGFYPYTYVRTTVMKALLFKKQDYEKLLKMSFPEIAKFMQESNYKKSIDSLATSFSGADLLELAINSDLALTFQKLLKISSPEIGLLIGQYSRRKDVEDIKTIIRGKFVGADEKTITDSLVGAGPLRKEWMIELIKKDSVENVLKQSGMFEQSELKPMIKEFEESNSLAQIENALDKKYYKETLQFAERLPKEGMLLKNFIMKEVEMINLLTIVRLRKAGYSKKEMSKFIIKTGKQKWDSKFESIAGLDHMEDIAKAMQKTEYEKIFSEGLEEYKKTKSLIRFETDLCRHVLEKSTKMLHMNMLSIDTILAFMFAKDIETRNLKIIIKGKQLGLSEKFIESQLVF